MTTLAGKGEASELRALPDDTSSEGDELNTRVLWCYFVGGMTQQQVADRLGLTRLRVNRIIGQARSEGLVHIEIRTPIARCVALAEALRERFHLSDAVVVPSLETVEDTQRVVGEAAGTLLSGMLKDGTRLGVGWGRTLSAAVHKVTPRRLRDAAVVTLMGSLTRGSGTNTVGVATAFGNRIGSECHYLAAPIYCPSTEIRAALLAHPGLQDVMSLAASVDIAVISAGDMTERSMLALTQIVAPEIEALKACGAVGDILGTFLDAEGRPVDHPLRTRVMGLAPSALKDIPTRILASGALHKAAIVQAVLAGGYATHLVTDETVAQHILNSAEGGTKGASHAVPRA